MERTGPLTFTYVWDVIHRTFPVFNDDLPVGWLPETLRDMDTKELTVILKQIGMVMDFQTMLIDKVKERIRVEVGPTFWNHFTVVDDMVDIHYKEFYNAVNYLFSTFSILSEVFKAMELMKIELRVQESNFYLLRVLQVLYRGVILSQLPVNYESIIVKFYEAAIDMIDEMENPNYICTYCGDRQLGCVCLIYIRETNTQLSQISLLEPLAAPTVTNLFYSFIYETITTNCKNNFTIHQMPNLEDTLQRVVFNWLDKMYFGNSCAFAKEFEKKLTNFLYNSYVRVRIEQLFNIFIEYPESLPALEELRDHLPKTDLKSYLIQSLQYAMETRLLHPGVSTHDILTAYISTIRSLRIIDPSGLLTESVTEPIHEYLRSRDDTVRCVVSSLTEEGPNDLAEELVKGEVVQIDDNVTLNEEDNDWTGWKPDPIDALPSTSKSTNNRRTSDIISMLVNVYGSKELFVNEYRNLLANRVLKNYSCDTEKEIRYIELLKLRFGESELHYCEVMLKDITDSKRINQHIKQDNNYINNNVNNNIPLSALIVSNQFWPPFKEEKLILHNKIMDQMNNFTKSFETLKGSRTLYWKHQLGIVDLEIEIGNRKLKLSVTPILATILMHFQDQDTWNLDDLSKLMQIPPTTLRQKMRYWRSRNIILESDNDVYYLQKENISEDDHNVHEEILEENENDQALPSTQDQKETELNTFWSYIVGMLMNLDTLPLERIHQMLKMFAFSGPTVECTLQDLKVFLDRKVRIHQLVFLNGMYKLPK